MLQVYSIKIDNNIIEREVVENFDILLTARIFFTGPKWATLQYQLRIFAQLEFRLAVIVIIPISLVRLGMRQHVARADVMRRAENNHRLAWSRKDNKSSHREKPGSSFGFSRCDG